MYDSKFFPRGRAAPRTRGVIERAAAMVPCHPAMIAAIVEVEAAGSGYWADGRTKVLYEPHWLNRLLPKSKRAGALAKGLSRTKWDRNFYSKYQNTADKRYMLIDRVAEDYGPEIAADCSSWGAGQTMGFNAEKCGYRNAGDMVAAFADNEDEQIMAIVMFCLRSGLRQAMQREDCRAIARVYNGPGQVEYYGGKMEGALARWKRQPWGSEPVIKPEAPKAKTWLGMGDKGDDVRALQRALRDLGYHLQVDGDFGPSTDRTLRAFQHDRGLKADGLAGEDTLAELATARPVPVVTADETATAPTARETATGDDLLKMGSSTVKRARWGKMLDTIKAGLGFGGAGLSLTSAIEAGEDVQNTVSRTQGLLEWLIPSSMAGWLTVALVVVGVIALIDWFRNNAIEKNKVEEYRTGKVLTVGNGEVDHVDRY